MHANYPPRLAQQQAGLPNGLHLVDSCENARSQAVRVGPNAADVSGLRRLRHLSTGCIHNQRRTRGRSRFVKNSQKEEW